MNKRRLGIITGCALILMAIIAGYSLGYGFAAFNPTDQIDSLKENIISNQGLYRNMLIGLLVILILDLLVSYTLYEYFRDDNPKISVLSGGLRIIYTLVFGIAVYYLWKNLNINEVTNQTISYNLQLFKTIWSGGLIIFGFHILLIGILMKIHKRIPAILWYLALIAGVSYIIVHLLKLTSANPEVVSILEMVLAFPMAIGELGLAIWLLVKGGKEKKYVNQTLG